ncbi:MAG: efflux RND transporter periplasmic adaptor subunit [Gammaproteobacteria bacterium]|nr:efflux RND transporter periplasmic adaptor subunit [Gammaproteobacteria bacterium]
MIRPRWFWLLGLCALGAGIAIGMRLNGHPAAEPRMAATSAQVLHDAPAYRAGALRIRITVDPRTPRVGENRLVVALRDSQGDSVSGARIKAAAEMPAMGAMPAMQAPARLLEIAPGRYAGNFNLSMSGEWPLSIQISKQGMKDQRIGFDMATGRAGLQVISGAVAEGESGAQATRMAEAPAATILVDSHRRQLIGLKLGRAHHRTLTRTIRAVGEIAYDPRRRSDISLRFDAWIGELNADYVGKHVDRGDVLFTVYGAELLAAQREYLQVLQSRGSASDGLIEAARGRLLLMDMRQVRSTNSRAAANHWFTCPSWRPAAAP